IRIGQLILDGVYPNQVIVALTGEGCEKNVHARTVQGAAIKDLLPKTDFQGQRCLTGSVFNGRDIGADGFIGFYDTQISVIPEGGRRELLGWLMPGAKKYTLSHTYLSAFLPEQVSSLDTDENGGHRAIVLNDIYDKYTTLDVVTYFLLKAVIAGDVDEAERLGILECDAEDFALCSFACPSKTNVGAIIRRGLDVIEKEG
ncbi:MAG: NADH:ubiquinone reductase (Na(+)-transporting) subunit A, partial [Candidatus Omnitrophica bacterium]|nr:NADH:ubiquinone reductase (Na(+)-transporting) subunit A [Candidatus Omnitrophota bacterium]